jgi:DNA-binding transcriptional ArsR family regulator
MLKGLEFGEYFYYCRNTERLQRRMLKKQNLEQTTRYADMFSAMGTESRLRIMQLLLSAHPDGLVVGEIGKELEIPSSTLSHHLEKLKNEDLVKVRREGTFLWYSANIEVLQELLGFLYAECCTRNKAIEPRNFVSICK